MRRIILGVACGLVAAVAAATSGAGSLATAKETFHAVPRPHKSAGLDPRLAASDALTVTVELLATRPAEARALIKRHGGRVRASYRGVVEAVVPKASLPALARSSAVRSVREPARPVPESVRGQGALSAGATAWHRSGVHGEGVKVAVVDLGFDGYARSQANGDLPSSAVKVNFCGSGGFEATSHGTAVAEIVAEVAPAADVYLVCVRDAAGLGLAIGYARAQGIQIVNHSASWFNTSRGDGTGPAGTPEGVVAAARAAGILWVNAAGNRAEQHWSGSFVDVERKRLERVRAGGRGQHRRRPGRIVLLRSPEVGRLARERRGLRPLPDTLSRKWDRGALERSPDRSRAADGARVRDQQGERGRDVCDRNQGAQRDRQARPIRPVRVSGAQPRASRRRRQCHRARHLAGGPHRRGGLLARQSTRDLQLPGADDRRPVEARPRRARLGLLLQLRPVLEVRGQRIHGHVCRLTSRRGAPPLSSSRRTQASGPTSCRPTSRSMRSTSARSEGTPRLAAACSRSEQPRASRSARARCRTSSAAGQRTRRRPSRAPAAASAGSSVPVRGPAPAGS